MTCDFRCACGEPADDTMPVGGQDGTVEVPMCSTCANAFVMASITSADACDECDGEDGYHPEWCTAGGARALRDDDDADADPDYGSELDYMPGPPRA